MTWVVPRGVDDIYLARLPFAESQQALSGGPIESSRVQGRVGWHGSMLDDHEGAFALVRSGGVFEHMLGERVRISFLRRGAISMVHVYVHAETGLLLESADISLPRGLYSRIAPLSEETVLAVVEVLDTTTGDPLESEIVIVPEPSLGTGYGGVYGQVTYQTETP